MENNRKRPVDEGDNEIPITEVKEIVEEIISGNGNIKDKEREFQKKYPHFAERYPMLFKMACKPEFDRGRFEQILYMMSRVEKNEISYDNATKQFGQDMFDTYVKPNLHKMKNKQ